MMDFVRSLAPARNEASGRAVALLRSRIARPLPISGRWPAALDAGPEPAEGDAAQAALPAEVPDRSPIIERRPREERARPALGPLLPRAQVAGAAGEAPEARPSLPVAAASPRHQTDGAMPSRRDAAESAPSRPVSAGAPAPSSSASPRDAIPASASAALPRRRGDASIAAPGPAQASAARTPAPLTATALAARVSSPAAAPTVVHVTIDRIDLRLPAPASAPARPPPRPRAGGVALADYLGARKAGGSGAPR